MFFLSWNHHSYKLFMLSFLLFSLGTLGSNLLLLATVHYSFIALILNFSSLHSLSCYFACISAGCLKSFLKKKWSDISINQPLENWIMSPSMGKNHLKDIGNSDWLKSGFLNQSLEREMELLYLTWKIITALWCINPQSHIAITTM